eukprot:GEMP01079983.1.p1 GENE.GEMP01079983.1~~GEMP01079983.1.p1  ORF type:complete len:121 (-),score=3.16 GEMP01079983.1:392-754(-)
MDSSRAIFLLTNPSLRQLDLLPIWLHFGRLRRNKSRYRLTKTLFCVPKNSHTHNFTYNCDAENALKFSHFEKNQQKQQNTLYIVVINRHFKDKMRCGKEKILCIMDVPEIYKVQKKKKLH